MVTLEFECCEGCRADIHAGQCFESAFLSFVGLVGLLLPGWAGSILNLGSRWKLTSPVFYCLFVCFK